MALSKRTNLSSNSDKKASNSNALPALPFKNTITMVLLGETGAGKSALINLFHFWSLESLDKQPKFKDAAGHSIIPKQHEAGGSQSGSQTLKPSHYQFDLKFGERTYCFSILDTPGMGDIKGLKNDDDNILAILKMIEETPSVDGIMLMLNGSNCRVSSRTQYILQRLYGMCPKTFEDHLYLIFSNTQLIPNFDWKNEIKVPIHKENVIPFDNLLYSPAGLQYETLTAIQRTKIEKNYEENKAILSLMFDQLIRGMRKFIILYLSIENINLSIFSRCITTRCL
jgi:GTPase SAR1 family protein